MPPLVRGSGCRSGRRRPRSGPPRPRAPGPAVGAAGAHPERVRPAGVARASRSRPSAPSSIRTAPNCSGTWPVFMARKARSAGLARSITGASDSAVAGCDAPRVACVMTPGNGRLAWTGRGQGPAAVTRPTRPRPGARSGDQGHPAALRTTVALRVPSQAGASRSTATSSLGGAAVRQSHEALVAPVAGEAGPGARRTPAAPLTKRVRWRAVRGTRTTRRQPASGQHVAPVRAATSRARRSAPAWMRAAAPGGAGGPLYACSSGASARAARRSGAPRSRASLAEIRSPARG